jgi:nucleotide-binding universal stress UspA family protein
MDINRILVPVSFAPSCKKAIRTAATLASAFEAKLYVVSVYRTPASYFQSVGAMLFPEDLKKEREQYIKELDKMVEREMRVLRLSVDVEEIRLEGRDPVKAILKIAKDKGVDLMVIGHHEESKLEHMLFGRNIGKLVDGAPCDVMVTRSLLFNKGVKSKKDEKAA